MQRIVVDNVIDFFVDYIKIDNLGIIANAHVVFADKLPQGTLELPCIGLAKLHSIAAGETTFDLFLFSVFDSYFLYLDFSKTRVPASMPAALRVNEHPDFMENKFKTSYVSKKVLRKIYRRSKESIDMVEKISINVEINEDLVVPGWEEFAEDAKEISETHSVDLREIMCRFEVYDKGQIFSKRAMKLTKKNTESKQQNKHIQQHLSKHVSDLEKSFRDEF